MHFAFSSRYTEEKPRRGAQVLTGPGCDRYRSPIWIATRPSCHRLRPLPPSGVKCVRPTPKARQEIGRERVAMVSLVPRHFKGGNQTPAWVFEHPTVLSCQGVRCCVRGIWQHARWGTGGRKRTTTAGPGTRPRIPGYVCVRGITHQRWVQKPTNIFPPRFGENEGSNRQWRYDCFHTKCK